MTVQRADAGDTQTIQDTLVAAAQQLEATVGLAARGGSPPAFDRRCIPPRDVAPPSNIPDIFGRLALRTGRIAGLGATTDFHHGLLGPEPSVNAPGFPRKAAYRNHLRGGRKFSITQSCAGSGLSVSVENVMRVPSG